MSLLKKLSKVDKRTKYAVYGWMRESEKELKLVIIPDIIVVTSILYFRKSEIFDIFDAEKVKLSKDGACITAITDHYYNVPNYGCIEMLSTEKGKYKWDLKVDNTRDCWYLFIHTNKRVFN